VSFVTVWTATIYPLHLWVDNQPIVFFFHKFIASFNYFITQIYGQVLLPLHKRIRALESRVAEKRALLRTVGYFNCLRFRPCIPSCVRTAFYKCFGDMDDSNSQTFASGYFSSSYSQIVTRILRVCERRLRALALTTVSLTENPRGPCCDKRK